MTAMDDANKKFIELYVGGTPVAEIAEAMGWTTKNPKQMVQAKVSRLRKAGHLIPYRGLPQRRMTVAEAQDQIDRLFEALRARGFMILHETNTGKYKVVER